MNKTINFIANDFPRAPSLLFISWIVFLVVGDLLVALGLASEPSLSEERERQNAVVHFVKFQTIKLDNFSIMVGSQYQTNDGSDPEKQWCYVDMPSKEGTHRINITLADKIAILPVIHRNISQHSANKLGLSPRSLKKLAKSHCNFL